MLLFSPKLTLLRRLSPVMCQLCDIMSSGVPDDNMHRVSHGLFTNSRLPLHVLQSVSYLQVHVLLSSWLSLTCLSTCLFSCILERQSQLDPNWTAGDVFWHSGRQCWQCTWPMVTTAVRTMARGAHSVYLKVCWKSGTSDTSLQSVHLSRTVLGASKSAIVPSVSSWCAERNSSLWFI